MPKYYVIQQLHEKPDWFVCELCKAVGVSQTAYYKWKNRITSQKQSDDEKLANLIFEIYQKQ